MSKEVLFDIKNGVGLITLNRQERLNALTHNMVKLISKNLINWEKDDKIKCVIIEGSGGKAFCAGGDVVLLRNTVLEEGGPPTALSKNFFYDEYLLNYKINNYKKPFIALIDGVTMGGGVGLSMHGSHVVSTEKTMFAMPETTIGLFPDVGGGWLLAQLDANLGMWLGLTGSRLYSYDLIKIGLCDFFVKSEKIVELKNSIVNNPSNDKSVISKLINELSENPENTSVIEKNENILNKVFSQNSIEEMLETIQKFEENGNEFCNHLRKELLVKSPTSLKITLKQINEAKKMSLSDELVMEYRMVQKCQLSGDFYEGVRSMLIDKDRKPKWSPRELSQVDDIWVNHFFEPLNENDLKILD